MTSCSILSKIDDHAVGAFAAQASFFTIISFFPFVMLLTAILKQLPFSTDELFVFSQTFFPKSFSDFFQTTVTEIPVLSSGAIISISAVTALWSASRGVYSIVSGLNSVYDVKETRSYIKTRSWHCFTPLLSHYSSSRCWWSSCSWQPHYDWLI